MPTNFRSLRQKTREQQTDNHTKAAGVDAPLPSDDLELDDADENTRNAGDESAEDMVLKAVKPHYTKLPDGSYTLNVEQVIREELSLLENAISNLQKIAAAVQSSNIQLKDGSVIKVDHKTAEQLLQTYGRLNKNSQVKFAQHLSSGKEGFARMVSFAALDGSKQQTTGLQGPEVNAVAEGQKGLNYSWQRKHKEVEDRAKKFVDSIKRPDGRILKKGAVKKNALKRKAQQTEQSVPEDI